MSINFDNESKIRELDLQIEILTLAQQRNIDLSDLFRVDLSKRQDIHQLRKDRINEIEDEVANRENITDKESDRLVNNGLVGMLLGSRPTRVNQLLKAKGDMRIIKYDICREPIDSKIKSLANTLTGGKFDKTQKKNNYDDIFHLYLVMTFEDGKVISIEKNEVVVVSNHKPSREGDCKSVNLIHKTTLNKIIPALEKKHGQNFYRYDARTFNCQNFVLNILQESGVFGFDNFIYQDFSEAISRPLREASGVATDIKGLISRFTQLFQPSLKL